MASNNSVMNRVRMFESRTPTSEGGQVPSPSTPRNTFRRSFGTSGQTPSPNNTSSPIRRQSYSPSVRTKASPPPVLSRYSPSKIASQNAKDRSPAPAWSTLEQGQLKVHSPKTEPWRAAHESSPKSNPSLFNGQSRLKVGREVLRPVDSSGTGSAAKDRMMRGEKAIFGRDENTAPASQPVSVGWPSNEEVSIGDSSKEMQVDPRRSQNTWEQTRKTVPSSGGVQLRHSATDYSISSSDGKNINSGPSPSLETTAASQARLTRMSKLRTAQLSLPVLAQPEKPVQLNASLRRNLDAASIVMQEERASSVGTGSSSQRSSLSTDELSSIALRALKASRQKGALSTITSPTPTHHTVLKQGLQKQGTMHVSGQTAESERRNDAKAPESESTSHYHPLRSSRASILSAARQRGRSPAMQKDVDGGGRSRPANDAGLRSAPDAAFRSASDAGLSNASNKGLRSASEVTQLQQGPYKTTRASMLAAARQRATSRSPSPAPQNDTDADGLLKVTSHTSTPLQKASRVSMLSAARQRANSRSPSPAAPKDLADDGGSRRISEAENRLQKTTYHTQSRVSMLAAARQRANSRSPSPAPKQDSEGCDGSNVSSHVPNQLQKATFQTSNRASMFLGARQRANARSPSPAPPIATEADGASEVAPDASNPLLKATYQTRSRASMFSSAQARANSRSPSPAKPIVAESDKESKVETFIHSQLQRSTNQTRIQASNTSETHLRTGAHSHVLAKSSEADEISVTSNAAMSLHNSRIPVSRNSVFPVMRQRKDTQSSLQSSVRENDDTSTVCSDAPPLSVQSIRTPIPSPNPIELNEAGISSPPRNDRRAARMAILAAVQRTSPSRTQGGMEENNTVVSDVSPISHPAATSRTARIAVLSSQLRRSPMPLHKRAAIDEATTLTCAPSHVLQHQMVSSSVKVSDSDEGHTQLSETSGNSGDFHVLASRYKPLTTTLLSTSQNKTESTSLQSPTITDQSPVSDYRKHATARESRDAESGSIRVIKKDWNSWHSSNMAGQSPVSGDSRQTSGVESQNTCNASPRVITKDWANARNSLVEQSGTGLGNGKPVAGRESSDTSASHGSSFPNSTSLRRSVHPAFVAKQSSRFSAPGQPRSLVGETMSLDDTIDSLQSMDADGLLPDTGHCIQSEQIDNSPVDQTLVGGVKSAINLWSQKSSEGIDVTVVEQDQRSTGQSSGAECHQLLPRIATGVVRVTSPSNVRLSSPSSSGVRLSPSESGTLANKKDESNDQSQLHSTQFSRSQYLLHIEQKRGDSSGPKNSSIHEKGSENDFPASPTSNFLSTPSSHASSRQAFPFDFAPIRNHDDSSPKLADAVETHVDAPPASQVSPLLAEPQNEIGDAELSESPGVSYISGSEIASSPLSSTENDNSLSLAIGHECHGSDTESGEYSAEKNPRGTGKDDTVIPEGGSYISSSHTSEQSNLVGKFQIKSSSEDNSGAFLWSGTQSTLLGQDHVDGEDESLNLDPMVYMGTGNASSAMRWWQKTYAPLRKTELKSDIENEWSTPFESTFPGMNQSSAKKQGTSTRRHDDEDIFDGLDEEDAQNKVPVTTKSSAETDIIWATSSALESHGDDVFSGVTPSADSKESQKTSTENMPTILPPPPPPPPPHPLTTANGSFGALDGIQVVDSVNSDITWSVLGVDAVREPTDWARTETANVIEEELPSEIAEEEETDNDADHRSNDDQETTESPRPLTRTNDAHVRSVEDNQVENGYYQSMDDEVEETDDEATSSDPLETPAPSGSIFMRFGCSIMDTFTDSLCRVQGDNIDSLVSPTEDEGFVSQTETGDNRSEFSTSQSVTTLHMNNGSSITATQTSLTDHEQRVWDDWERRDSQSFVNDSSVTGSQFESQDDISSDTNRMRQIDLQERRAEAQRKLLQYATAAKSHQDSHDPSSTGPQTAKIPPLHPRHKPVATSLSLNQRRILEKFSSTLKNQGMEVLKLNRDRKWQLRHLTVSKEVFWLNAGDANARSGNRGLCPRGILWMKRFIIGKEQSISVIDKQGRGGLVFTQLQKVSASGRSDPEHPLTKKHLPKFKDSVSVNLEYSFLGSSKSVALRCRSTDEAHFLCTGLRVVMDVLKREGATEKQYEDGNPESHPSAGVVSTQPKVLK